MPFRCYLRERVRQRIPASTWFLGFAHARLLDYLHSDAVGAWEKRGTHPVCACGILWAVQLTGRVMSSRLLIELVANGD
jgi:hypothetical protein